MREQELVEVDFLLSPKTVAEIEKFSRASHLTDDEGINLIVEQWGWGDLNSHSLARNRF